MRVTAGPRRWRVLEPSPEVVAHLSSELGLSRLTSTVLANRGVSSPDEARAFLARREPADTDPFLLDDMDRAVTRVLAALQGRERVAVYGDYDADGLTATALLVSVLEAAGAEVTWYIPDRSAEGYGLNAAALEHLRANGVGLVVTVDCGVTALPEAALARRLGLGLVITDHHEPGPELPAADAVVNPRRPGSRHPSRDLAGVGVAYKLAQALVPFLGRPDLVALVEELVDLVALGTVADVVPLLGENRALVSRGLERLNPPRRLGLEALCRAAALHGRPVGTYHLAFQLGPRLNAAGRVGDAARAVRLLLTRDAVEAAALATELDQSNRERQALEEAILTEALRRVGAEADLAREMAIVLAGEGWHEGVIGIVASRLVEMFARPALLVAMNGAAGRGSGRSIPAFNLVEALRECSGRLGRYGGHRLAAGFELEREAFDAFRQDFLEFVRARLTREDLVHELRIDACVEPRELAPDEVLRLLGELELIGPHGPGNPEPLFAVGPVTFASVRRMGEGGRHLRALARCGGVAIEVVGFGRGDLAPRLGGRAWDLAFRPELDEWQGRRRLRLNLVDVREAAV